MIAVAAFPIIYAIWLSLQRYDLRFPSQAHFIGFSNYGAVLSSPYLWHALWVTLLITVVSVAIELVLGMLLALLMYRTLFWRGAVRTTLLIPYGIVTVVAAFSWAIFGAALQWSQRCTRPAPEPIAAHLASMLTHGLRA